MFTVTGGSWTVGDYLALEDNGILRFGAGDGTVTLNDGSSAVGALVVSALTGGYIDFLTGTEGALTVEGYDATAYEALWDAGDLRINGTNAGTFSQSGFQVDGETLTLVPEPATLALATAGLGLFALRRRRWRG